MRSLDYYEKRISSIITQNSNNKDCREYMEFFRATSNYSLNKERLSNKQDPDRQLTCLKMKQQALLELEAVIPEMRNADAPEIFNKIAADLEAISVIVEEELSETAAAIVVVARNLLSAQNRGPSVTKQ